MDLKQLYQDRHVALAFFLFVVLAAILYSQSWFVPFYFDDFTSIIQNQALLNGDLYQYIANRRAIPHLSFWIDYQLWGGDARFFHLQNIFLHALNAFLIFWLVKRLSLVTSGNDQSFFAIFVALLWLTHPLNSQPVIYIVQRMTLWMTLFCILTLIFWVKYRLAQGNKIYYLLAAIIFAIAALLSKETAIMLPVVILLIDAIILKQPWRFMARTYGGALILFALLAMGLILSGIVDLKALDSMTREHGAMSRLEYFFAQQEIVAQYLRKFFVPHPLLLEYPYFKAGSLSSDWPWLLLHLSVVIVAIALIFTSPLFSFGILFYYVFSLVESGLIPITDLAFEHRTYLPNVGLTIAVAVLLKSVFNNLNTKLLVFASLVLFTLLSALTFTRVLQWQDPLKFYTREYRYNNETPRILYQLGVIYSNQKNYNLAERYFSQAFHLGWKQQRVTVQQAEALMEIFFIRKKFDLLERLFTELEQSFKDKPDWRSVINAKLASFYLEIERCDLALPYLQVAMQLDATNQQAAKLLAQCQQQ